MNGMAEQLGALAAGARDAVSAWCADGAVRVTDEASLIEVLAEVASVQRLLDAVAIETVGEVVARSETGVREDRMTSRFGCHDVSELVQRVTLVSRHTAGRWQKVARSVRQGSSVVTGQLLEPELPSLRTALLDGVVGGDGALAIAGSLQSAAVRASHDAVLTADEMLAAQARGDGPDGAPPACADVLRVHAQVWATVLDQDGAEPRERVTIHKRGVTLGAATEAGVPLRGTLMPEVAAQLQRISDTLLSPRVDGVHFVDPDEGAVSDDVPRDTRTRAQKQHDALANALSVAASSGLLPTIGGSAPTLVVSVREEDLRRRSGYAHVEGSDQPVSIATAEHVACAGVIQRIVFGDNGRILRLGTEERVFNRRQRRAIALRDGGCVIPGCGVPAAWCEIHHVTDYANGGPTHTDIQAGWAASEQVRRPAGKIGAVRHLPVVVSSPSGAYRRLLAC